jgi:biotin carboxylase
MSHTLDKPRVALLGPSYLRELGVTRLQQDFDVALISSFDSNLANLSERFIPLTSLNIDGTSIAAAIDSAAIKLGGLDGVICLRDPNLLAVAAKVEQLNLKFPTAECLVRMLDKFQFRQFANTVSGCVPAFIRLVPAGLAKPVFYELIRKELGKRPLILKPRFGSCSYFIVRLSEQSDLQQAWDVYSAAGMYRGGDFILETCIQGKEYSIECVVQDGLRLALKTEYLQNSSRSHFAEVGHYVQAASHNPSEHAMNVIYGLVDKSGLNNCILHVECIERSSQEIFIVEVNPRIAGDHIPELHRQVHGIDLYRLAAIIASGITLAPQSLVPRAGTQSALIRFCAPGKTWIPSENSLSALKGLSDRACVLPVIEDAACGINNDCRSAFCFLVGDDLDELVERSEWILT